MIFECVANYMGGTSQNLQSLSPINQVLSRCFASRGVWLTYPPPSLSNMSDHQISLNQRVNSY